MPSERPLDSYLSRLDVDLRAAGLGRRRVERTLAEARDHLEESVHRLRERGFAPHAAEREAIALFGGTHDLANRFLENDLREMPMLRVATSVLAALTIAAACLVAGFALLTPVRDEPTSVTALKVILSALVAAQSVLALFPASGEPRRRLTCVGAIGLLVFGVLVATSSVCQGLAGPDPSGPRVTESAVAALGLGQRVDLAQSNVGRHRGDDQLRDP